jgi:hypothetical protein
VKKPSEKIESSLKFILAASQRKLVTTIFISYASFSSECECCFKRYARLYNVNKKFTYCHPRRPKPARWSRVDGHETLRAMAEQSESRISIFLVAREHNEFLMFNDSFISASSLLANNWGRLCFNIWTIKRWMGEEDEAARRKRLRK